ncbi:MAG: nitroreductase/quinone reductase family protein [Dehalococcoidia bacterium]
MSTVEERHAAEPYCYLTTIGRVTGEPHEIEIWFAAVGDTIYLMNGGTRRPPGSSDWVRNARANPSVRVRIGADPYAGQAREVAFDSEEHERARSLLVGKYASAGDDLARWRATAFPIAIALRAD